MRLDLILRKLRFPDLFITNINNPIIVQEDEKLSKIINV